MFHAMEGEAQRDAPVQLRLVDGLGRCHHPDTEVQPPWNMVGVGPNLVAPVIISLDDWSLPRADLYRFEAHYLGGPIGQVEFIAADSGPVAGKRPAGPRRTGIRMEWGHVVDEFRAEPNGLLSLAGVVEALILPPFLDFLSLSGGSLVVMISTGADDGPDHAVQVVLHDEAGQTLGEPANLSVRCGSVAAGYPQYGSLAVPLKDLTLGRGTYSFRVSVDGSYVESLVLPVVAGR
jgi:hypothetical protein